MTGLNVWGGKWHARQVITGCLRWARGFEASGEPQQLQHGHEDPQHTPIRATLEPAEATLFESDIS